MRTSTTEALQAALSAALPPERVRPAETDDAVAGMRPRMVVTPESDEEVAALLAAADAAGLTVLVRGGGTQSRVGAPPTGGDLVLSLRRLTGVIEHAPHDQTVTVRSGTPLVQVQAALASAAGQWLALDPALDPAATIGGIIATNASGAHRLRAGGVRDQLLGVRVALADGALVRGGGKVVKNVAGYDLPKLFCGALGTLGVVVAATFRLYPLPAVAHSAIFEAGAPGPLCALALRVNASTLVPAAMDLLWTDVAGSRPRLALRFESGIAPAIADQLAALATLADALAPASLLEDAGEPDFWRGAADLMPQGDAGDGSLLLKASLLPTALAEWLERLRATTGALGVRARVRAHAGHGLVYTRLEGTDDALAAALDALRADAARTRGSVVVQDAPLALLHRLDIWGPVPALDVMRRLKAQFDPHATLNPGRFVGGL
ncbi:MAG: FAD-binding oxidoreductase [Ktedonobacterales bacterium]